MALLIVMAVLVTAGDAHAAGDAGSGGDRDEEQQPIARDTFDGAVRRALDRNPTVAVAVQEIRRAEALVGEVRSASLPTLVGSGAYTLLDGDRKFGANVIAAANSVSLSVTLAVPLISPKSWTQWSHARENVTVSARAADDVRRLLAVTVGHAYLTVISQKRIIEADLHARDADRIHYDFAYARRVGGVGNRIDEVRAAQEVASDVAELEAARAGLAKAREALGVLVGSDAPLDAADEPEIKIPASLDAALSDAAVRRADVKAAEVRLRAAHHVERDDWADYMPLLTGVFQPFYQNPPTLLDPLTGWQAQLVLTLPLYDGGLRYGLAGERAALTAEAKASLESAFRQARSDVRAAFESLRRADQGLAAARTAARLAHEGLDLATLAYRAGATSNLEVIDAERRARDADTAVAVAEDSARQARLDLLAGSGRFP